MSSIFSVFTSASNSSPSHPHHPSQPSGSTTTNPALPTSSTNNPNTTTQQQRTAEARAAFDASLAATGQSLNHELHARATNIHENAKELDKQDVTVKERTEALSGDVDELEAEVRRARGALDGAESGGKGMAEGFEEEIRRIEAELDDLDGLLGEVEAFDSSGEDGGSDEEGVSVRAAGEHAVGSERAESVGDDQMRVQDPVPKEDDRSVVGG